MTTSQDTVAGGGYVFDESDRIRKAREALGLSQTELALRARLSRGTVQNYEAGHRVKPLARESLAKALLVTEDWLQTGELTSFTGPGWTSARADGNTGRYGTTGAASRGGTVTAIGEHKLTVVAPAEAA